MACKNGDNLTESGWCEVKKENFLLFIKIIGPISIVFVLVLSLVIFRLVRKERSEGLPVSLNESLEEGESGEEEVSRRLGVIE